MAEYGPCLFFQSGNFQGVGIVVKISLKNLSHRKVLSPHSSKSQLFSRAPAPCSSLESLNFHLRIKITALRPQKGTWAGFGGIGLISASPNGTCQEESIDIHPAESLSKLSWVKRRWEGMARSRAAQRGCQRTNLYLTINRSKHPLQDWCLLTSRGLCSIRMEGGDTFWQLRVMAG